MAAAELTTNRHRADEDRALAGRRARAGRVRAVGAALLAGRGDVDLHHAIDLLRNGCSPELALQILL